jgi:cell wall-associated NlpC family hydrolase
MWTRSSIKRRIGSATVICTAGTGALLGTAGTASAIVPTEQTIETTAESVVKGTEITFTGTLTGFRDQPLPDEEVTLQWRGSTDKKWQDAATVTTGDEGVAAIPATITRSAEWRISFPGDRINNPASSGTVRVESEQPAPKPEPKPEPDTAQPDDSDRPINQRIVDAAAAQAGKPYSYGSEGPSSFDCSGFTQYVHRQVGIELPRTSSQQRAEVPEIAKSDMVPGDLVFFHDGGTVYHVGIFAGSGQMWAAPESGDNVRRQDIWTDAYTVGRAW